MHTVVALARRPGATINDYLAGRRAGYVSPVKFLVIAVSLALLALWLIGSPDMAQSADASLQAEINREGYDDPFVEIGEAHTVASPAADAAFVVLRGQDGARSSLPLEDLLAPDVLLADRLNGEPLSIAHGAPLRLVAPAHYGYKSVKHLHRIEFRRSGASYRPVGFRFMDHPRARVAVEERGRWIPGWILRHLYRPLIRPTALRFERALERHLS